MDRFFVPDLNPDAPLHHRVLRWCLGKVQEGADRTFAWYVRHVLSGITIKKQNMLFCNLMEEILSQASGSWEKRKSAPFYKQAQISKGEAVKRWLALVISFHFNLGPFKPQRKE